MVSHRRNRRMRAARIRGLLLSYRDILVLAVCAAGLLGSLAGLRRGGDR